MQATSVRKRKIEPESSSGTSGTESDPAAVLRVSALTRVLFERTLKLYSETVSHAFHANLEHLALLSGSASTLLEQWNRVILENGRRTSETAQIYRGILLQAHRHFAHLSRYESSQHLHPGEEVPERRGTTRVINFPDRRVSFAAVLDSLTMPLGKTGPDEGVDPSGKQPSRRQVAKQAGGCVSVLIEPQGVAGSHNQTSSISKGENHEHDDVSPHALFPRGGMGLADERSPAGNEDVLSLCSSHVTDPGSNAAVCR
jgi:hypothetical protein